MSRARTYRTVALLAVAVAIPSGIAFAAVRGDDPGEPISEPGQRLADVVRAHTPAHSGDAVLADRFSVLSQPVAEKSPLGDAAEHTHTADVSRAHVIPRPAAGSDWDAWIAPGSAPGEICLLAIRPPAIGAGSACDSLERAASGKLTLSMGSLHDGPVVVLGAMPDGVDEVTLTLADGATRRLIVHNNAYRADVNEATRSITFTLPGADKPTTIDSLAYSG
ncbi:hypothetical protein Q5424_14965 [Conexibacter sp. JD483]|uniref:hypothetical protein n=1 Tax=unclassified Conexibacter TaxID=2627773 RepID=UPI002718A2DB|nr:MULTISPECIES: hypothetical protein [unclassified Conexibacter]MDO8187986.1 hypothetical protein [Conexibacter sp. CPCC 205706]MDO8200869.1 hypothetical protein [Conexibacter sp. CPCC 205762]MDR9370398.1 hypothetical protein [Conexibacter sp. JD483]